MQEEFPSNPIFQMSRPVYDVGSTDSMKDV